MSSNMYLKFEDPDGGSGKIEVLSWSHGFPRPPGRAAGSGTVERANHANFNLTKYLDVATNLTR